ncbi:MAG: hypothetical protein HYT79_01960 [Elusimicrobia bacterium]|nr:hypothetical protein [Elusimicrobiota bacterium]
MVIEQSEDRRQELKRKALLLLLLLGGGLMALVISFFCSGGQAGRTQVIKSGPVQSLYRKIDKIAMATIGRPLFLDASYFQKPDESLAMIGTPEWRALYAPDKPEDVDKNDLVPKSLVVPEGGGEAGNTLGESSVGLAQGGGIPVKSNFPNNIEEALKAGKLRPLAGGGAANSKRPDPPSRRGATARPVTVEESGLFPGRGRSGGRKPSGKAKSSSRPTTPSTAAPGQ